MTWVSICGTVCAHVGVERRAMAKDQKPADQMDAFSKQAMEQAHEALDLYFDFLKKSVSSFPSGGTELGEKGDCCRQKLRHAYCAPSLYR